MQIFDLHADTISKLIQTKKELMENNLHIDAKRLFSFSSYVQVFAVFSEEFVPDNAKTEVKNIIKRFYEECEKNKISICKNYNDYMLSKGRVKAFLSIEGGYCIENLTDIDWLYNMGVRMIAPTWNYGSGLASGVLDAIDSGLSEFGKSAVVKMNELGIIIDVSHISEKSFWDIIKISRKPVIASHSNLKSVKENPRNLTDEQFSAICKSGGVCGINLYPLFFGDDIKNIVEHVKKMLVLGGEDNIAIGADFDGIDRLPVGVCGVEDMEKVIKLLPVTREIREKIAFRNALRVLKLHNM